MEALGTLDSDISAAQAKLKELQAQEADAERKHSALVGERQRELKRMDAQIEEKRHAVAGVNAEVETALEKLAVVHAETNMAQLYHDQILDSMQFLRRQFACSRTSDRLKNAVETLLVELRAGGSLHEI